MGHDILEVASIPRERKQLAGIIGQARYARRRARLMQIAAAICILAGLAVLWITFT